MKLTLEAKPFSLSTPRRVPLPLMQKVKDELIRMEQEVIRRVKEPTEWCTGMVGVPKPNNRIRMICVDLTKLNEAVRRKKYILPAVEHTLGMLGKAKVYSKLDANSGFWQICQKSRC